MSDQNKTWNCLGIIVKETNAVLEGKEFISKLDESSLNNSKYAFCEFPNLVEKYSASQVNLKISKIIELDLLKKLTWLNENEKQLWPAFNDINDSLKDQGNDLEILWWEYDSIFVIWPIASFKNNADIGRGDYKPANSNGATYSVVPGEWKKEKLTEGLLHEWLHGVCSFFSGFGWAIPFMQSDGAGFYNYSCESDGSWGEFYTDLMQGKIKDKRINNIVVGGISKEIWHIGTPTNPGGLIGLGSNTAFQFQEIWKNHKLNGYFDIIGENKIKVVRKWEHHNGCEIQSFINESSGFSLIFRNSIVYITDPSFLTKFPDLGLPEDNLNFCSEYSHQLFTNNGWSKEVFKLKDESYFIVLGSIYRDEFKNKRGTLGHPITDEYNFSMEGCGIYRIQKFKNGFCWFINNKTGTHDDWPHSIRP